MIEAARRYSGLSSKIILRKTEGLSRQQQATADGGGVAFAV